MMSTVVVDMVTVLAVVDNVEVVEDVVPGRTEHFTMSRLKVCCSRAEKQQPTHADRAARETCQR